MKPGLGFAIVIALSCSLGARAAAAEPGEILDSVMEAVTGLVDFFIAAATGNGPLATQAKAQEDIRTIVTEVAFPAPAEARRPGVLKAIPIVMGEVRSLGTEIAELEGDWRFSERTAPMQPQRRADARPQRVQLEALFGPSVRSGIARQELHRYAAVVSEDLISSHIPASGQWATALPVVERDSAVGSRRTPGEALRDTAWLAAGAGRVAQNNSDLMAQRLALGTLEFGEEALEHRLETGVALSLYAGLACLSDRCEGGRR